MLINLKDEFHQDVWDALSTWGEQLDPKQKGFYALADWSFAPGLDWTFNSPVSTWFLVNLVDKASEIAGKALRPCHSVLRCAFNGQEIVPHLDGEGIVPDAADINLNAYKDKHWGFTVERDGETTEYNPEHGEGVFFHPLTEKHGRVGKFDGDRHVNMIFCYAEVDDAFTYKHQLTKDKLTSAYVRGEKRLESFA